MIKKQLGNQIAFLRREAGLTQEALAELADYSVEFISFVERGINAPSIEGCARIAAALNIPVRDLFVFDKTTPEVRPNSKHTLSHIKTQASSRSISGKLSA